MRNDKILISGAGIAGPAVAYWLEHYGFTPTVVERASGLRDGGHAVDFRGPAHLTMLRRMGVLDEIKRRQTDMGAISVVDADGAVRASLPSSFMSGEVEIQRGDLSRILYEHTKDTVEYVFGDWITSLTENADGVHVTFAHGEPRDFDLVIGADGMHSAVRALTFGDEHEFVRHLGYYVAGFTGPNRLGLHHEGRMYSEPGRGVMITSHRDPDRAANMLVFPAGPLGYDRQDQDRQKKIVAETFANVGWQVPNVLADMWAAPDLYFDSISQIHLDHYTRGRVALLGDAGYGATMGGLGSGLATLCAYVLAGELALARGDHRIAFAEYERAIRDTTKRCQKMAKGAGNFFAPPTEAKIRSRDRMYRMLRFRPLAALFDKSVTKAATAIELKDYPA